MDTTETAGVFARDFVELDRAVQIGVAGGRIISVSFPATVPSDASENHELFERIDAYLGGESDGFDNVEVGLTVPTDQRTVLESLRSVPYGEAVSVSRLTRMAGLDADDPEHLKTVTAALNDNPIPLLFPDHRVDGGPYATPTDARDAFRRVEGL